VLRIYYQKAVTPNTNSIAVNEVRSSSGLLNRFLDAPQELDSEVLGDEGRNKEHFKAEF
jgi:hypothetical protein